MASAIRIPNTPTGRQCSMPPQLTACRPPSTTAAPTSPPTSAWPELDGRPSRQVTKFQVTAAARPAPITSTVTSGGTVTSPPIVSATAAPRNSGPSRLNTDASRIACSGVAARVATKVAIAFDASWSPFVTANPIANSTATTSSVSTSRPYDLRLVVSLTLIPCGVASRPSADPPAVRVRAAGVLSR